jgi:hypothetical protein
MVVVTTFSYRRPAILSIALDAGQCPVGVKSDGLAVGRSLPVYPYQQTSSDANGKSQKCQNRTSWRGCS